jgi:hypothetical protein
MVMAAAKDPHDKAAVHDAYMAEAVPQDLLDSLTDPEMQFVRAMIEYWFDNHYGYELKEYPKLRGNKPQKQKQPEKVQQELKQKQQREQQERTAKVATLATKFEKGIELKVQAKLSEMLMPNGKPIAQCTGKELRKFETQIPAWLNKLVAKVKPNQLAGDVLTEAEYRSAAPKGWA